jgi:hypothetical protein
MFGMEVCLSLRIEWRGHLKYSVTMDFHLRSKYSHGKGFRISSLEKALPFERRRRTGLLARDIAWHLVLQGSQFLASLLVSCQGCLLHLSDSCN